MQCENDNCDGEEGEKQHNVYSKEENEKIEQAQVDKESDSNNEDKVKITKKKKRLAWKFTFYILA